MKPTTQRLALVSSVLACSSALLPSAQAGGISLYEMGTPDVGLASAGYAARAQDASTLFRNPAGMSLLDGSQMQSGLQLLYGSVNFSKDKSDTSPTLSNDSNGGNAIGALPGMSLFLVHKVSDKLAIGFGTCSYFGMMESYDANWAGRYYIQSGTLAGLSFLPSASYQVTDWLSIGAGLNAMYGMMDTEVAVRTGAPDDGKLKLSDEVWGFGANVGVMFLPCASTRIGVTYLSKVDLDFKTKPQFSNLGPLGSLPLLQNPPQLKLGISVPQMAMVGVYHDLNPKWALMADVGWQDWSQFGKVDVGVDSANPGSLTKDLKYQDTWHGALGVQYKPNDRWVLSSGVAYDSSAVDDKNRTVTLPMGEAYRFGLGAEWKLNQKVTLGAAYELMWAGSLPVEQGQVGDYRGRVSGSYDNAYFSVLALNLTWRF